MSGATRVEIAGGEPALDARAVDLGDQADPLVHGHGERLGAAHAAEAGGDGEPAGERAAEVLAGGLGEGLVGALEDPLGADVDPRAGGHLAVHGEAEPLQPAELVGGGPVGHQHRVGDQHPRRLRVGLEHRHRLAGLDEQRLLVAQPPERRDDRLEALPVARRLPRAAIDHQLLRPLGDLGVEVVHQHPQRGLLLPAAAGDLGAAGSADGAGTGGAGGGRGGAGSWVVMVMAGILLASLALCAPPRKYSSANPYGSRASKIGARFSVLLWCERENETTPEALPGHDPGYKRLFSHPQAIEELLRGFLPAGLGRAARLPHPGARQERLHQRRPAGAPERRHLADALEGRDGRLCLYLLLEFQSTSYPFMAVRMLTYVGLLLEEIIRKEKLEPGDRLPVVLPVVLYNGKRSWRAPLDLASLFAEVAGKSSAPPAPAALSGAGRRPPGPGPAGAFPEPDRVPVPDRDLRRGPRTSHA